MAHDLRMQCALLWQVARDRLIGPQGQPSHYTDKLLKLGRPTLKSVWGASWDLAHLAKIELIQHTPELQAGGRQVVVLTRDQALIELRSRVHDLHAMIEAGGTLTPLKLVHTQLDPRLHRFAERVGSLDRAANDAAEARVRAGEFTDVEHIAAEASRLERQFRELFPS